jgi:hypothetical protein
MIKKKVYKSNISNVEYLNIYRFLNIVTPLERNFINNCSDMEKQLLNQVATKALEKKEKKTLKKKVTT